MYDGLGQSFDRPGRRCGRDDRLDVGCVPRLHAPHESVFSGGAFGEEFLRSATTHGSGGGRHDHVVQAEPTEDPLVGIAVCVVSRLEPVIGGVKGIRVLHHEFSATQDARPRPRLVPVLGLYLVEDDRKILVGAVLPLDREREQFLVGRAQHHVVVAAVLEPEQRIPVLGPSIRGLVGRARQQGGQQNLLATNGIHLFANDVLDLAQHPQPEWQPAVHAGCDGAHVSRADQQLVAGNLGVSRIVAQRTYEKLGEPGNH